MQWDALAFLPHPTDITDIAPPPTICLCSLRSAGLVKRVWPAPDQWLRDQMAACWAGFTSPVAVVYVLLCCWGVFPVLTLYSPRSIVWGLFFSPHFPHVNAVFFFNSTCISLLIILVWLCMWWIIKNLEPWTLNLEATIALQDPLPVAYSYSSQSKRNGAFAHNTDPHISFLVLLSLLRFYQFPTPRSRGRRSAWYCLRSLLYLTSPYSLLQQHHCSTHQMLLPRCHR